MKKLVMLFLFAIASMSFKAEAINWKKVCYGTGTTIGAASTVLIPLYTLFTTYYVRALGGQKTMPNGEYMISQSDVKELTRIARIFGSVGTLLSAYLTKKFYDKYQEEAAKK